MYCMLVALRGLESLKSSWGVTRWTSRVFISFMYGFRGLVGDCETYLAASASVFLWELSIESLCVQKIVYQIRDASQHLTVLVVNEDCWQILLDCGSNKVTQSTIIAWGSAVHHLGYAETYLHTFESVCSRICEVSRDNSWVSVKCNYYGICFATDLS